MRQVITLLTILTPSARACFDTTRGGCFTAGFVDNLDRLPAHGALRREAAGLFASVLQAASLRSARVSAVGRIKFERFNPEN